MKYLKIATIDQYNKYCALHEKYGLESPEEFQDDMELLEILINEYDCRTHAFSKKMNPVELLDSILEEEGISKSELARSLETSKQLISDILLYKRNISKEMVIKLSAFFKMRPEAFSRPYRLKKRSGKRIAQIA
jgi:HTH-type transcriptional regulator/antitoxin HigA